MGRVIVCGGGICGLTAALSAAWRGAEVEVWTEGAGISPFFTGVFFEPETYHPGENFIEDVVEFLTNAKIGVEGGGTSEILMADGGTLSGILLLRTMRAGLTYRLKGKRVLLLSFSAPAPMKVAQVDGVNAVQVKTEKPLSPHAFSLLCDLNPEKAINVILSNVSGTPDVILIEASLGWENHQLIIDKLQDKTGAEVGEVPSLYSRVPGLRLLKILKSELRRLNVKLISKRLRSEDVLSLVNGEGAPVIFALGPELMRLEGEMPFLIRDPVSGETITFPSFKKRRVASQKIAEYQLFEHARVATDPLFRVIGPDSEPIFTGKIFACGAMATGAANGLAVSMFSSIIAGQEAARSS